MPILSSRFRLLVILPSIFLLAIALLLVAQVTFEQTYLADFTVTYYRAANYLLHGDNVYFAPYPHPSNGRDYPTYSPIWIVFPSLPLNALPLDTAEAVRFLLDLAALPLLVYIALRWTHLKSLEYSILLVIAPWHVFFVFVGHYSALIWIGIALCYYGIQKSGAWWIAVGLFFLLLKPHVVSLVILATVVYAWQQRILAKSIIWLGGLILISTLAQPSWAIDMLTLWIGRLANPRFSDAIFLVPGYPWTQLVILAVGAFFFLWYGRRSNVTQPTRWLWSVLIGLSLLGALHSYLYDWLNLLFPMTWLLSRPRGAWVVVGTYLYSIAWLIAEFVIEIHMPPATIVPALVLLAVLGWRLMGYGENPKRVIMDKVNP